MTQTIALNGLSIDHQLYQFINEEALPGTGITPRQFWGGFASILEEMVPRNRALLARRDELQMQIDAWWKANQARDPEIAEQEAFLREIGYIVPEGSPFTIETETVDDEIAAIAGPQLVVPVQNARYALNAANARWGSLYDALYGSDVIEKEGALAPSSGYNEKRGEAVIAWGRDLLDKIIPLTEGSHHEATHYHIEGNELRVVRGDQGTTTLKQPDRLVGWQGSIAAPKLIGFENHGLHVLLKLDSSHPVGRKDQAHVSDIIMEAAISTIMDAEDSVAAVDAADKVQVYRNWLGLMQGTLEAELSPAKIRKLAQDIELTKPNGKITKLKARSLMLVRNVGHLMTNPAIRLADGGECPEGIMDAVITSLIGKHDLLGNSPYRNSQKRSIYIVKPKMHGPDEVKLAVDTMTRVEELLELPANTIKIGIMDEERRTTLNLQEAIRMAKERVFFINTGFLDRSGDEIHTCMEAGPVVRKAALKNQKWILAYEDWNTDIGLQCGLPGRAQIGKGMWPAPDAMKAMMEAKIAHPQAGASTAWVPSPTAAVLHACHYHQVNVKDRQQQIAAGGMRGRVGHLLAVPVAKTINYTDAEIQQELDNNCQSLLGYVVRWVDAGVGCSKVPDIHNLALMEDRATLRISSQLLANWLYHGLCRADQIEATLRRMAVVVDGQNAHDASYQPMGGHFDTSLAFQAARMLVFEGRLQPNGYTEPILHAKRLEVKAKAKG